MDGQAEGRRLVGAEREHVERTGEGEWRVIEPAKGTAKSAKVEDLLYTLRGLKWKDVVAPTGQEPAKYGLDKPSLELRLFRADGTELAGVVVGKADAEQLYVKTHSAPAIYAVDAKQVGTLPKSVDEFKG